MLEGETVALITFIYLVHMLVGNALFTGVTVAAVCTNLYFVPDFHNLYVYTLNFCTSIKSLSLSIDQCTKHDQSALASGYDWSVHGHLIE